MMIGERKKPHERGVNLIDEFFFYEESTAVLEIILSFD